MLGKHLQKVHSLVYPGYDWKIQSISWHSENWHKSNLVRTQGIGETLEEKWTLFSSTLHENFFNKSDGRQKMLRNRKEFF